MNKYSEIINDDDQKAARLIIHSAVRECIGDCCAAIFYAFRLLQGAEDN